LIELDQKFEYLFVESQGAISDPIRASVSIGILHGTKPDAVILSYLVESAGDIDTVVKSYENYKNVLKQIVKADLIGVALNTALLSEEDANEVIQGVKEKIHLPVIDPVRSGVTDLVIALKNVEKITQN